MARNMHKYEDLTPNEFDMEKEKASIIYLASGPLEYHEGCNALGVDLLKGYNWCLKAAEKTGGIVFPPLPVAPDWVWPLDNWDQLRARWKTVRFGEYTRVPLLYPGVMFSRDTTERVFRELLETFSDFLGFKLCVMVGSHGPSGQLVKNIIARENGHCTEKEQAPKEFSKGGKYRNMEVLTVGSLDYSIDFIREHYEKNKIARIGHGGMWEAAYNYAVNPEYFQMKYLDKDKYPQHYGALTEEYYSDEGPVTHGPEEDYMPASWKSGIGCLRPFLSEYRKFTPEFAEELERITVERMAQEVSEKYASILAEEKN